MQTANMAVRIIGVSIAYLVWAPHAATAGHVKPGMWKITTEINIGAATPQIPPEQLARLKSLGINLPTPGQGITTQQCVTPAQAARDTPPHIGRNDSGCTEQNQKITGAAMSADLICTGTMKGQGTMQMSYADQEHYSGSFTFKGVMEGRTVDTKTTITGEWLSTDCR